MRPEMISIGDTVYKVLEARTPDQCEADGHANTARHLRKHHIAVDYWLQRPSGNYVYVAEKFEDGTFSRVRQMPMRI